MLDIENYPKKYLIKLMLTKQNSNCYNKPNSQIIKLPEKRVKI